MISAEKHLIKTPIQTYEHLKEGKLVTLVGVVHMAQQSDYYPTIQDIIDGREADGAVVHFEGVRRSTKQEAAIVQPSHAICNRVRRLRKIIDLPKMVYGDFNFFEQGKALKRRETWENHDATELQIAQRMPTTTLMATSLVLKTLGYSFNRLSPEERLALYKDSGDRFAETSEKVVRAIAKGFGPAIEVYRNDIALNAYDDLQEHDPGRDAVLLWGAGHLPGLGEGLVDRGFGLKEEQTLLATDMNEVTLKHA
ncbi:MAG TPA: hypothetical protein VF733_01505 [Candidatus Saccharimonadales bacterium]